MTNETDQDIPFELIVPSTKNATDFYTNVLGMKSNDIDEGIIGEVFDTGFSSPKQIRLLEGVPVQAQLLEFATDDCIRDFHRLKLNGLCIEEKLTYISSGLKASFKDPFGNTLRLIEERNYKLK